MTHIITVLHLIFLGHRITLKQLAFLCLRVMYIIIDYILQMRGAPSAIGS